MDYFIVAKTLFEILRIAVIFAAANGVLIVLASHGLTVPAARYVSCLGVSFAVVCRIFFFFTVSSFIDTPLVRGFAAVLVTYIASRSLMRLHPGNLQPGTLYRNTSRRAMSTIILADLLLAFGNMVTLHFSEFIVLSISGLAVSLGLVIAVLPIARTILMRVPRAVWGVALFLGWTGGQMIMEEPIVKSHLDVLGAQYGFGHKATTLMVSALFIFAVAVVGLIGQRAPRRS